MTGIVKPIGSGQRKTPMQNGMGESGGRDGPQLLRQRSGVGVGLFEHGEGTDLLHLRADFLFFFFGGRCRVLMTEFSQFFFAGAAACDFAISFNASHDVGWGLWRWGKGAIETENCIGGSTEGQAVRWVRKPIVPIR